MKTSVSNYLLLRLNELNAKHLLVFLETTYYHSLTS